MYKRQSRLPLLAVKGGSRAGEAFARHFPHTLAPLCPGPTTPRLGELPFTYRNARRASLAAGGHDGKAPSPPARLDLRQARET